MRVVNIKSPKRSNEFIWVAKPADNFSKIPLRPVFHVHILSNSAQAQSSSPASTMESSRGPPRVKNKAPAPQQISAEQLLREAVDRQEIGIQAPTQRFADLEELHEFQGRKRKEFEDYVRRNRINMNNWMRYAQWGIGQKAFRRYARPGEF